MRSGAPATWRARAFWQEPQGLAGPQALQGVPEPAARRRDAPGVLALRLQRRRLHRGRGLCAQHRGRRRHQARRQVPRQGGRDGPRAQGRAHLVRRLCGARVGAPPPAPPHLRARVLQPHRAARGRGGFHKARGAPDWREAAAARRGRRVCAVRRRRGEAGRARVHQAAAGAREGAGAQGRALPRGRRRAGPREPAVHVLQGLHRGPRRLCGVTRGRVSPARRGGPAMWRAARGKAAAAAPVAARLWRCAAAGCGGVAAGRGVERTTRAFAVRPPTWSMRAVLGA
ncbi:MAG: hypothetical protein J3K34DRAFT_271174 [Monoraphidium minutum]|nr:MAG: hypothetical protein J3K34DRAFT_271174 [Monoraphidium minutum]